MQRARRWGAVHLRAGREIGEWWRRIKRRRGRPKLGNSPIFPTSTQLADKLGLDRRDITRLEALAHIPAALFEEYLLETDAPSYFGYMAYAQGETAPGSGSAHSLYSKQFLKSADHALATANVTTRRYLR